LLGGCVEEYDPNVDYFPDKVTVDYAEGFTVEYFANYKVIDVLAPWPGAEDAFQYVLVQCGTPAPEGYDDAQVVEVPIDSTITLTTTQLPHMVELGVLDALVGVDTIMWTNTAEVIEKYDAGELAEVGNGAEINVEMVLDAEPDIVMASGSGLPDYDAHPVLLEAGIPVALNAEWVEELPLGRAEWIKFTAAFFNAEAAANAVFDEVAANYEAIAALTADIPLEGRPRVFANTPWEGTWYVPGGSSYGARFLADAGANYLWADDDSATSLYLDFETVFVEAADADFWINTGSFNSLNEMLADDERFVSFIAFQNDRVYNNNARVNESGGSDYWESGTMRPDLILADLVKIFYPELVPEHEFVYYQQLKLAE
jgi:iron complex transport system substrate-binding protein